MNFAAILDRLHNVKGAGKSRLARCPAHEDNRQSLSISEGDDGRILLRCHAGCETTVIVRAMGLQMHDLFPPNQQRNGAGKPKAIIQATYDYLNERGEIQFQSVRYTPKDFRQRRPDGHGGWIWNLQGVERVPYRLPELIQSVEQGKWICVVEGEKDVDRLHALGITATTNAGGAGKWRGHGYEKFFTGARVCVIPDNDTPGRKHGEEVAQSLDGIATEIRILDLPNLPPKGDVSDWLDAGGTRENLLGLIDAAPKWTPSRSTEASPSLEKAQVLDLANPLDVARKFLAANYGGEGRARLVHYNGGFLEYKGARWADTEDQWIRSALYHFIENGIDPHGKPLHPNRNRIDTVNDALRAEAHLSSSFIAPCWLDRVMADADPLDLLPCANGLLHLPTRKLIPTTADFFNRTALDLAYDPDASEPECWLKFLAELWRDDPDCVNALQEFIGLLLTPDTRFQKILMIVGPKRSGKGTIARVLVNLLGVANVAAPTLSGLSTNFGLSPLIDKLAAIISDARLSNRPDQGIITERLLSISGEDFQTVDRKHKDPITRKITARIIVLTNELPKIADSSTALANRFIILPLTRTWLGKEDSNLLESILPERAAILNWGIKGRARLYARGRFIQPKSGAAVLSDLADLGSPVAVFVRERCDLSPCSRVECGRLFEAWIEFAKSQGRDHPGTIQGFGRDLRAAYPEVTVKQSGESQGRARFYGGIALRGDSDNPSHAKSRDS